MVNVSSANRQAYGGARVLVTGADGFIGSHLTEHLAACGAHVTALSQYNSFAKSGWLEDVAADAEQHLAIVHGDVRDAAFVRRITSGQDIVFHLAALIAIPYSYVAAQSYVETNMLGTINVLEAAREHKVRRVVQTSTSEVYGTAITVPISETHPLQGQSPYSASKIGADMLAESFARSFGLPVAILRPFNSFGPRQSERAVIPTIMRQVLDPRVPRILIGDTSPSRDFTFVDDTVSAFLAIGASAAIEFGRPYNAGTGEGVTVGEVLDLILHLTGTSKSLERDETRTRPPNSEVRVLLADSSLLREATGWVPGVKLSQGLEQTIAWWRGRLESGRVRRDHAYAI
jgi:NAD dependent epimerase/dehydratase